MDRLLHNSQYSDRILQMTADTMLLFNYRGDCVDMIVHANQGLFRKLKNYIIENFFNLLIEDTKRPLKEEFRKVVDHKIVSTQNYELPFEDKIYYFKCIMYPFEDNLVLCQFRDITKRTKIKLELQKANKELQEVDKAAKIGQWRYNYKDNTFYHKGYTGGISNNSDYKSVSLDDYLAIIHHDDRAKFVSWLNNVLHNSDGPETFKYRIKWKENFIFFRVKVIAKNTTKGHEAIEGYSQNITDIIKLDESLENVTKAINYASEDIFAFRPETGALTFANEQFRKNHLLPQSIELSKIKVYNLNVSTSLKERWENIRSEFSDFQDIIRYVEQKPFPHLKNILAFDFFSYIVRDSDGEDVIWTFGRDISEQIRYDAQMNEVNQIMNTVLENISLAISVKDTGNNFRYIYRNSVSYISMKTKEVIGKTDFDIYPDETAITYRNEDIAVKKTGTPIIYDREVFDNNGEKRIIHKLKMLAENGDREPLIIALESDITNLKRMESELISAKEKAEKSDMLKSAFLANMSHEIRTPLNAIVGFSRVIADTQNADERMDYYKIVEANNSRLLLLINEILDLSRIESGMMEFSEEPINMSSMCREVFDAHRFRCSENVNLIFEDSDPTIWIYSDKNRLIQVFSNLIGNALKFTSEGSIKFGYNLKNNYVECYVKDTGIGFPKEKALNVFERFAKLNNNAQGTGLGLSICKSIIEKLGGKIEAKSEEGKGAEFIFTHPYISPEEAIEKENGNEYNKKEMNSKANESKLPETKERIILVAEDNESNFKLLNAMIGKSFTLLHAHDGIEAVTMFEEHRPNIILMDIKMPNMDGLDATRIIRQVSSEVPIIALSAFVYNEDIKDALNCGCNEFISKPISFDSLTSTLKKYL